MITLTKGKETRQVSKIKDYGKYVLLVWGQYYRFMMKEEFLTWKING